MPRPNKSTHRYISGLDGLRALSVLAVILYHLHIEWIDGGFLGVTVFFVLSGYLITDLLVKEWDRTGKINFKTFWIKRFRRLIPALVVMLVLMSVWITLFQRSFLVGLRGEIVAAFTYVSNWYYVLQDHSYFTKFAPPSPLQHMWSLAVEEQFYIIWPVIMLVLLKFLPAKGKLAGLILLLSFVSAEMMAFLFTPDVDPSRIYYGTDTRAFSLLIGAALAIVWPSAKLTANVTPDLKKLLNVTGGVSLTLLILMMIFMQEDSSFLYYGGMYLASAVTAVLIAVIVHPASSIGKLFSFKPLLWVGVRSYGIYIWHFPIIVLMGIAVKTDTISMTKIILALVLTFVLSALSWRYIEDPIRKGAWKNWLTAIKTRQVSWRWKEQSILGRTISVAVSCILIVFAVSLIYQPQPEASNEKILQQHLEQEQQKNAEKKAALAKLNAKEKKEAKAAALKKAKEQAKAAAKEERKVKNDALKLAEAKFKKDAANAKVALANRPITALGDSVLLSASTQLQEFIPNITINAKVGLQVDVAIEELTAMAKNGQISHTVFIGLGSNGTFTEQQFEEIYAIVGKNREIYLMNTNVDRSWKKSVNKNLDNAAKKYKNVHVIDWDELSKGKPQLFYKDKIHPNPEGGEFYASHVAIEIAKKEKN